MNELSELQKSEAELKGLDGAREAFELLLSEKSATRTCVVEGMQIEDGADPHEIANDIHADPDYALVSAQTEIARRKVDYLISIS